MTTPEETPSERPTPRPGNYGEISPGVPRYGQYAPEGWVSPVPAPPAPAHDADATSARFSRPTYPGSQDQKRPPLNASESNTPASKLRVAAAVRLIRLAGVLQGLVIVLLIITLLSPSGKAAYLETMSKMLASYPDQAELPDLGTLMNLVIFTTAIFGALFTACYFFLASRIGKGSNGARITALVLMLISLVGIIGLDILNIVRILLGVYAMVILFRDPAKRFFENKKVSSFNGPNTQK